MIVLRDSMFLEGLLASASTAVEFHVAYADQSLTTFLPGGRSVDSAGTTAVLLAGPAAAGAARQVKSVLAYNGDASTQAVTLRTNDGSASRIIKTLLLLPGNSVDLLEAQQATTFDAAAIVSGTLAAARLPADLPDNASLTTTAFGQSLLTQADAATARGTLGTNNAGNLTAGVVAEARGGAGAVSGLLKANGSGLVSAAVAGTDYLLPSGSGAALTALNASNISTGTLADARLSANVPVMAAGVLPAASGANLTALNATNLASGTVPAAQF